MYKKRVSRKSFVCFVLVIILVNRKIGDYDYVMWITRDDGITLSLEPKDTVRTSYDEKEDAWDLLCSSDSGYGGQSRWQNEQCMKWQFDCHYSFANTKTYWNIEPWRTASSYIQVVASACNP